MALLEISQLSKSYGNFSLGPLNLSLDEGCALGLVGANGAGKTTLFRNLIGTVRRDKGSVSIGYTVSDESDGLWRQRIGYVADYNPLFDKWSGQKNLETIAPFYPNWSMPRSREIAERLNLDLQQKVKHYSTGQRTKLAITLALSHSPPLLLLDEPTAGLDPVSREIFMELLFEQMATGRVSLVYATHHISEIEHLADRLVFLNNGEVLRDEVKEDLVEKWRKISFRSAKPLQQIPHVQQHKSENQYHELITDDAQSTLKFLTDSGAENIESSLLSIEKIAVQILKGSIKENRHV